MSYQEKRTITSIVTGALVIAAYCIYAFGKVRSGAADPADLKFWAASMLIFIGIGIGVTIAIQIVFHILLSISIAVKKKFQDEKCDDKEIERSINAEIVEDERDKLIELKAERIGFYLSGAGFVAGLICLAVGQSPAVMMNVMYLSFSASGLLGGFIQLYFYRRGIRNA
jgi:hypothetical protein